MDGPVIATLATLLVTCLIACAALVFDRARLIRRAFDAVRSRDEAEGQLAHALDGLRSESERRAIFEARVDELQVEATRLQERLESREREHATRMEAVERARAEQAAGDEKRLRQIHDSYQEKLEALASKALRESNEQFLKLAGETFAKHQKAAEGEIDERRRAFAELVKPIGETLKKTDQRLETLDRGRIATQAALQKQLELLAGQAQSLENQTGRLVQSLRAPQVRGRWGEMTLRRVVELAGMSEHCDFLTQASVTDTSGEEAARLRPDMVIRMPGDRVIIVDAKAPLSAYLEAIEADSDDRRAERLKAHARQLKQRIDELSSKSYQSAIEQTPDFTVLFVPGDQFLSAALAEDAGLLEYGAARQVILTTPGTLIALLKAVAFGWSQASLAEDAAEILKLGREMHERLSTLSGHLGDIGRHLTRSVASYNKAVGSFERRVMPAARRLEDHHIRAGKELAAPAPVLEAAQLPSAETDADAATDADEPAPKPTTRRARPAAKKKATRRATRGDA